MALEFQDTFESGSVSAAWGTPVGPPVVSTDSALNGSTHGLKVTGAGVRYLPRTPSPATPNEIVGRVSFRVPSGGVPTGATSTIVAVHTTTGNVSFRIGITVGGDLFAQVGGPSLAQFFDTLTVDTTYDIDFDMNCSTTTGTIDWQVNGVDQTQATNTITVDTFNAVRLGNENAGLTSVLLYLDDYAQSQNPADYPIGPITTTGGGGGGSGGSTGSDFGIVRQNVSLQEFNALPDLATAQAMAKTHWIMTGNTPPDGGDKFSTFGDEMIISAATSTDPYPHNLLLMPYLKGDVWVGTPAHDFPERWYSHSAANGTVSNRVTSNQGPTFFIMQPDTYTANYTDTAGLAGTVGAVYPNWKAFHSTRCAWIVNTYNNNNPGSPLTGAWLDSLGSNSLNGQVVPGTSTQYTTASWYLVLNTIPPAVKAKLPAGFKVFGNGISGNPDLMNHVDGLMIENWIRKAGDGPLPGACPTDSKFQTSLNNVIAPQNLSPPVTAQAYSKLWTSLTTNQQEQWRRFLVASYYIANQGNIVLDLAVDNAGTTTNTQPWNINQGPSFNVDLKDAMTTFNTAAGYQLKKISSATPNTWLYGRRYVRGFVLVNVDPTTSTTYTLPRSDYKQLDGTAAGTTITIPPATGIILTAATDDPAASPPPPSGYTWHRPITNGGHSNSCAWGPNGEAAWGGDVWQFHAASDIFGEWQATNAGQTGQVYTRAVAYSLKTPGQRYHGIGTLSGGGGQFAVSNGITLTNRGTPKFGTSFTTSPTGGQGAGSADPRPSGRLIDVVYDGVTETIWVAATNGIAKSTDAGNTWTTIAGTSIAGTDATSGYKAIAAIDANNALACLWFKATLIKITNGVATNIATPGILHSINNINGTIWACGPGGLYTWNGSAFVSHASPAIQAGMAISDIDGSPDGQTLYCITSPGTLSNTPGAMNAWKSTNGGTTWATIGQNTRTTLANGKPYWLQGQTHNFFGDTNWAGTQLAVNPQDPNQVIFVGKNGGAGTKDGGLNIYQCGPGGDEINGVKAGPGSSEFACTDTDWTGIHTTDGWDTMSKLAVAPSPVSTSTSVVVNGKTYAVVLSTPRGFTVDGTPIEDNMYKGVVTQTPKGINVSLDGTITVGMFTGGVVVGKPGGTPVPTNHFASAHLVFNKSTLVATGKDITTNIGAADLLGVATLSATGVRSKRGTATLTGIGSLVAQGHDGGTQRVGGAHLTVASSLIAATGKRTAISAAHLTGLGTLSASTSHLVFGAVVITNANALLTASGIRKAIRSAALTGIGSITASGAGSGGGGGSTAPTRVTGNSVSNVFAPSSSATLSPPQTTIAGNYLLLYTMVNPSSSSVNVDVNVAESGWEKLGEWERTQSVNITAWVYRNAPSMSTSSVFHISYVATGTSTPQAVQGIIGFEEFSNADSGSLPQIATANNSNTLATATLTSSKDNVFAMGLAAHANTVSAFGTLSDGTSIRVQDAPVSGGTDTIETTEFFKVPLSTGNAYAPSLAISASRPWVMTLLGLSAPTTGNQNRSGSDSGVGTDISHPTHRQSDSAVSTDKITNRKVVRTDTSGLVVDHGTVGQNQPPSTPDFGTGMDAITRRVIVPRDTALGTESRSLTLTLQRSDSAIGQTFVGLRKFTTSDIGVGTEVSSVSPLKNTFESGVNGNAVTFTNTIGSGNPLTISPSSTSPPLYDSSTFAHGSLSAMLAIPLVGGSPVMDMYWPINGIAQQAGFGRAYVRFSTFAVSNFTIQDEKPTSPLLHNWNIGTDLNAHLVLRDSGNNVITTSTSTLVVNTWYRIEWNRTLTTLTVRFYASPDAGSITETLTANIGGLSDGVHFVNLVANTTVWFDDLGENGSTWFGPSGNTIWTPKEFGVATDFVSRRVFNQVESAVGSNVSTLKTTRTRTDNAVGADTSHPKSIHTDSGIGTDSSSTTRSFIRIDTGLGTDSGHANTTFIPAVDSALGTDFTARKVSNPSDSAIATDLTGRRVISRTDTGTGTELPAPRRILGRTDTGLGSDFTATRKITASDKATGIESIGRLVRTRFDSGIGTDTSTNRRSVSTTGTATDASTLTVHIFTFDNGIGTESHILNTNTGNQFFARFDSGVGADFVAGRKIATFDTAIGSNISTPPRVQNLKVTDLGHGIDVATLHAVMSRTDSGTSVEKGRQIRFLDTATDTETSTLRVNILRADTGLGTDQSSQTVTSRFIPTTDSGAITDFIAQRTMMTFESSFEIDELSSALIHLARTDIGAGTERNGGLTHALFDTGSVGTDHGTLIRILITATVDVGHSFDHGVRTGVVVGKKYHDASMVISGGYMSGAEQYHRPKILVGPGADNSP